MSIEQIVIKEIANHFGIKESEVTIESTTESLGADSLDDIEIIMEIEDVFDIELHDADLEKINNVGDLIKLVEGAKNGQ
jgi:acyl carrier protein